MSSSIGRLIYVAGRVRRYPTPMTPWVARVLTFIRREAAERGLELFLPEPEPELESAAPQEFFHEINKRIGSADAVITLWENDAPSAVEATLAAVYGKPQMIVTLQNDGVPRLLAGAPGQTQITAHTDLEAISAFLQRVSVHLWEVLSASDEALSADDDEIGDPVGM